MKKDIFSLVGNTPLVEIKKIPEEGCATILAKLEMFNPSGSIKDRAVKYMLEKAMKEGKLSKTKTIIEPTSGNTGISLAMFGAALGYKVIIVMPESMSVERRKIIEAYGAELILVPDEEWRDGAISFAKRLAEKNGYVILNQYENEANVLAHYETTGEEIIRQTGGKIDAFVAGIGTGGTIMGVGKRLKEHNPKIRIVGVEVYPNSKIQGLRNFSNSDYKPPILDVSFLDEKVMIRDEDAFEMTKRLAREEGLFVGLSSGANMYVALQKAKELGEGKVVVTVFPDGGNRYLSVL
ncbi:MAG: cysteine synthase family protein [Candidatus Aenigmarchaeota archaeon]|nr:cysteine synthase family protein [Candidatus Aenigmarchaeota archaeon]MDW8160404.1 cysteine synthase family protein [Candidatus Aenigmarchaeota archaeon]